MTSDCLLIASLLTLMTSDCPPHQVRAHVEEVIEGVGAAERGVTVAEAAAAAWRCRLAWADEGARSCALPTELVLKRFGGTNWRRLRGGAASPDTEQPGSDLRTGGSPVPVDAGSIHSGAGSIHSPVPIGAGSGIDTTGVQGGACAIANMGAGAHAFSRDDANAGASANAARSLPSGASANTACSLPSAWRSTRDESLRGFETMLAAQNAARKRHHAGADERRNRLLDTQLFPRGHSPHDECASLSLARAELARFSAELGAQPAVGPVLLGAAALLTVQSRRDDRCGWVLERSALLNCGDEMMRRLVRLMMDFLGLRRAPFRAGVEDGADDRSSAGTIAWIVENDRWTPTESLALATVLRRLAARQPIGRQPAGKVLTGQSMLADAYRARLLSSWRERLFSDLAAWRVRFGWGGM